jgi:fumarylacetoacetase
MIDETHDAKQQSWVKSAQGHAVFPLQNLPFGIFSPHGGAPRGGVAIGDEIFDLKAAVDAGLFSETAEEPATAASGATLNPFMTLGKDARAALRRQLWNLLSADGKNRAKAENLTSTLLHKASDCTVHLPAAIGSYTDFNCGIHHAYNGGVRNKRATPLNPNYKFLPEAYHSRASSIVASGAKVKRPNGQGKLADEETPRFGPVRRLDFELELGVWIGPGNALGDPIPIAQAREHIVGFCMLNDWSARDVQGWEGQPLGPFNAKNFTTTISPWVVTAEALEPFRQPQRPRAAEDPRPMPYLWDDKDQQEGALDVNIEALILTEGMKARGLPPHRLTLSNTNHLYWTVAQMVAHHTCGGCNLQPGDIFGSGTISGPEKSAFASIAELCDGGKSPIPLPSGETRTYIEDGDEIIFRASAQREGYATIGFGDCRGQIVGR